MKQAFINVIATVKWVVTSWHNSFSMCQSMLSTSHIPIPACLITTLVFSSGSTGVEQTLVAKLDGARFEGPVSLCGARQGSTEEGPCVQLEG